MRICIDLRSSTGCHADNPNDATRCRRCGRTLRYALQLHDPGDRVGDYDIVSVIGFGAFGAVYRAQVALMPSVRVAIKESFNPQSIRAFADEFALLAKLQHPNLPRYFDTFEADDCGYLVMEFVPGQSLEQVLQRQKGPLAEPQVLGYAVQICDVLAYLHQLSPVIVHRDVKPANIRVTPAGLIKLVDFGLVKSGEDTTRDSRRGLTPAYAPPEQWGDGAGTTARSDIYSLGATLYHLLTGKRAPSATERIATDVDPLVPPREVNPELSEHVSSAIMRAMSLRAEQRFPDAATMRRSLLGAPTPITTPLEPAQAREEARLRECLAGHSSFVWGVAWSPEGRLVASCASDQSVRVWDTESRSLAFQIELPGFMNSANALAFSPTGSHIAVGGNDGQVWVWSAADGAHVATLRGHSDAVTCVAFSPDGKTLASGSNDTTVRLWNVGRWTPARAYHGHTQVVHSIAWSPDGQLVASAGGSATVPLDRSIRVWRPEDGRTVRTIEGHTGNINSVAWSPDGQLIASTGGDRSVRVWRAASGEPRHVLMASETHGAGGSVAFSPDSRTLASGHWDNAVRIWSVPSGELVSTLREHTDFVKSVAFSPRGRALASGADDRTVRIWDL